MRRIAVPLSLALTTLTFGCAADSESLSGIEQEGKWGCSSSVCGNSPEVAHYGLWEANIFGVPDTNKISIKTQNGHAIISKNGVPYQLYVVNGRIEGRLKTKLGWITAISGTGLVGASIELVKNGTPYYNIHIAGVRTAGASFVVGAPDPIETYVMRWYEPGSSPSSGKALCNNLLQPTADAKTFELLGMQPDETLVFEGDRIDAVGKTMSDKADDDWFNIGCAGHTLAKLQLTRNTIHSQPAPDWAQRQTTLKMLVADYCGGGESFTLAGEPLVWKGGLQPDYPHATLTSDPEKPLEARWFEGGAFCLGQPRIEFSTLPQAPVEFPDVRAQISAVCPNLPPCTTSDPEDLDGAKLVSANRKQ